MIFEGKSSIWIAGQARLVEEDRDLAWAERTIKHNPAFKWVLGRYVEADRANSNLQFWQHDALRKAMPSIVDSPINMLHQSQRVVGHYVDAEMMYPTGETAAEGNPFVEALGVVYKYYFPQEVRILERAHAEGALAFSMECVTDTLTCGGEHGCGSEFAYKGPTSDTYCEHINKRQSYRQFNNPHFLAGALLVPPVNPGWKNAKVTDFSELLESYLPELEAAQEDLENEAEQTETDVQVWQALMGQVVQLAVQADEKRGAK